MSNIIDKTLLLLKRREQISHNFRNWSLSQVEKLILLLFLSIQKLSIEYQNQLSILAIFKHEIEYWAKFAYFWFIEKIFVKFYKMQIWGRKFSKSGSCFLITEKIRIKIMRKSQNKLKSQHFISKIIRVILCTSQNKGLICWIFDFNVQFQQY